MLFQFLIDAMEVLIQKLLQSGMPEEAVEAYLQGKLNKELIHDLVVKIAAELANVPHTYMIHSVLNLF